MHNGHKGRLSATVAALAVAMLMGAGCVDDDRPCGSWRYVDGFCQPPLDAAADLGAADRAAPDGSADQDGTGLDAPCTTAAQCTGAASYCAYNPMTGVGFCTFKDCSPQGNDCPTGWQCFDGPTLYPGMGVPTMCVPQ